MPAMNRTLDASNNNGIAPVILSVKNRVQMMTQQQQQYEAQANKWYESQVCQSIKQYQSQGWVSIKKASITGDIGTSEEQGVDDDAAGTTGATEYPLVHCS